MICKQYSELIPIEQRNYIGALVHSVMNDEGLFLEGVKLIKKAEKKGLFDGVLINPPNEPPDQNNDARV